MSEKRIRSSATRTRSPDLQKRLDPWKASGRVLPNARGSLHMLAGDAIGNKTVNASDVGQTKAQSGQPVTTQNFRTDVTANGAISASDVALVKSRTGSTLSEGTVRAD